MWSTINMIDALRVEIYKEEQKLKNNPLDASARVRLITVKRRLEIALEIYGDAWYDGYLAACEDNDIGLTEEAKSDLLRKSEIAESEA